MTTQQVLKGQKALVTGASSGIGAAIANGLAAAGAEVAINYPTKPDATNRLIDAIESAGGRAIGIKADVSKEDQVKAMFKEAIDSLGTIDILVNNAGVQRDAPVHKMSLQDWEFVLGINLTGQFLCSREAINEFLQREVPRECSCAAGKIICISSVHDRIPWAGHANYSASKGGVTLLMMTMAQELSQHKIRVNSISPGAIKTPINRSAWETPEKEGELVELIPYGRIGKVEDIANAAVWLASDASDYVTGTTIYVDGGMTLYPGFREGG
jgi:glucose 1-dehydrogenase